jgi:integrase
VSFVFQVDRRGYRQPLKTEESARTVELPRQLATALLRHKLRSADTGPEGFVFASRSGRPLLQRNVARALRAAQMRASDGRGRPTFPVLQRVDQTGRRVPPPKGAVPSFHSFRHTAASRAIAAGESAEEVAWQLGHRNSVITRAVYVHEIRSAERATRRPCPPWGRSESASRGIRVVSGDHRTGADRAEAAKAFFELVLRPLRSALK